MMSTSTDKSGRR